jgi:hypothetical protein
MRKDYEAKKAPVSAFEPVKLQGILQSLPVRFFAPGREVYQEEKDQHPSAETVD